MREYNQCLDSIKATLLLKGNIDNIKVLSLNVDLKEIEQRFNIILSTAFLKNLIASELSHAYMKRKVNDLMLFFDSFEQNRYFKEFTNKGIVKRKERLTFLKAK